MSFVLVSCQRRAHKGLTFEPLRAVCRVRRRRRRRLVWMFLIRSTQEEAESHANLARAANVEISFQRVAPHLTRGRQQWVVVWSGVSRQVQSAILLAALARRAHGQRATASRRPHNLVNRRRARTLSTRSSCTWICFASTPHASNEALPTLPASSQCSRRSHSAR